MSKNIVLFIDGTGQDGTRVGNAKTNVWKLYVAALRRQGPTHLERDVPVADPGTTQVCHYINGIATDRDDEEREKYKEAVGLGAADRIRAAYLFLALNYDDGDNVYLFGFSRGAFAVRSLAGFVGLVGILFKNVAANDWPKHDLIADAYALYAKRVTGQSSWMASVLTRLKAVDAERFGNYTDDNIPPIPIHFIGVWDTVRMLGTEPLPFDFSRHWTKHHDLPALPAHISHARHALAIHETRPEFEPTVWETWGEKQTLEQVWFPGDHTDVGGGHDDGDTEHSDATLEWIATEAGNHGLDYDASVLSIGTPAASSGRVHHLVLLLKLGPRKKLRAWDRAQPRLVQSFRMHPVACEHLLRETSTKFKTLSADVKKWKRWRPWDPSERDLLDDVDKDALDLHLALGCVHGLSIAGRSGLSLDVASGDPDWWRTVSLDDVRKCAATLADFIEKPEAGDVVALTTPLRLFVMCGRDELIAESLEDATNRVLKPLADDPCSQPHGRAATEWSDRLGELGRLFAGDLKATVARLSREIALAKMNADAKCLKSTGKLGLKKT